MSAVPTVASDSQILLPKDNVFGFREMNDKKNKKGSGKKIASTKRNKRRVGGSIIEGENEGEHEKSNKKGSLEQFYLNNNRLSGCAQRI